MKRGLMFVLLFLVLVSFAGAENLYVTQNGGGSSSGTSSSNPMSVSTFNSASKWGSGTGLISPGDTVYFSGLITSRVQPPEGYGGTSGAYITLDGYEGGDCNHMNGNIDSRAAIIDTSTGYGIELDDNHYLNIQDFGIRGIDTAAIQSITSDSSDAISHINFKRIGIEDAMDGIRLTTNNVGWTGGSYITIEDSLIKNIASGDSSSARGHIRLLAVNDLVIRRNYLYNEESVPLVGSGQDGMVILSSSRVLIEYNKCHHMSEDCLDFKDDADANFGDVIIRYNHFADTHQSTLTIQDVNGENAYVYGNLFEGKSGDGVRWGGIYIFRGFEKVAAWSNIIYDTDKSGIIMFNQDGSRPVDDGFFSNNIIVSTRLDDTAYQHSGIALWDRVSGTYTVKNNILVDNAINDGDRGQIYTSSGTGAYTSADYNIYWISDSSSPRVYWGSSSSSDYYSLTDPVSGTSFYSNTGQGAHGRVINPRFTSLSSRDLTLASDSPAINTGDNLNPPSWWNVPTIQGVDYSSEVSLSSALDPSTNWQTAPPTVIPANQNSYGAWERGAYVYTGGSVPTYQCTNSILPNAVEWDSEESTGLTANTPWTFSATDTTVKCQYHCSTGYSWTGSACVAQAGTCPEGLITSTCLCGGTSYSSGYCCSGTWQSTSCTTTSTTYTILKTTTPPTINGDISEFADANEITLTDSLGTTGHYKFLWDSNYLYVAAEVYDSNLNADLAHQDDDGIYTDDSMEFMFDTANDGGTSMDYDNDYKFYVNVNNINTDSQRFDASWDSGMNSVVNIGTGTINNNADTDTRHTIEARIPWSNWATPINDEVWGMNLVLNDKPDEASYPESVQWSEAGLAVNVPNGWNDVTFSSQTITPPVTSSCNSGADISGNSVVEIAELINFIGQWKTGDVTITELINAIGEWKAGCS